MDWEKIKEQLEGTMKKLVDMDKDGDIDVADVAKLLKRIQAIAAVVIRVTPTDNDDAVYNGIVKPILDEIIKALGG